MRNRRQEIRLKPAQAKCVPDEVNDVPDPNFLENVGRLHGPGNSRQKLIISCRVLPLEKGGGPNNANRPARSGRLAGVLEDLGSVLLIKRSILEISRVHTSPHCCGRITAHIADESYIVGWGFLR